MYLQYIAMVAGEVRNPRPVLKKAFKTVYIRFALFFIGSAIFVGIALPPDDPTLNRILSTGSGAGTGAADRCGHSARGRKAPYKIKPASETE